MMLYHSTLRAVSKKSPIFGLGQEFLKITQDIFEILGQERISYYILRFCVFNFLLRPTPHFWFEKTV